MAVTAVQHVLEALESLPIEEQRIVVELVRQRLAEARRKEIARNAKSTLRAVRGGKARVGSARQLRAELELAK